MTKRILTIFILILVVITITQTAFAAKGPDLMDDWKDPYLFGKTRLLPFAMESADNMSQNEYVLRLIGLNLLVFVLVPIIFEIVFALLSGIRKLKPVVLWSILLDFLMIVILISGIYFTKGIYILPLLALLVGVCILKYSEYKRAYKSIYTEKKVRTYIITIGIVELVYLNIMMLLFKYAGLA